MNGKHLTKLRKGMVIRFPDGHIEVILGTGYIGKSDKFPHKKGRHYIFTDEAMYFWGCCEIFKDIEILGYTDYIHKYDLKQPKRSKYFKKSF